MGVAALRIMGGSYGRRVTVVAGEGSNGADARVAAPRPFPVGGVRVTVLEAADQPDRLDPCDLVIDGAYGTGFHGRYDAPSVPGRDSGPVGRPAVGPRRRYRCGHRRRGAGHPHGDLRRPEAWTPAGPGPAPQRPRHGGRHRDRHRHAGRLADGRQRHRGPAPTPAAGVAQWTTAVGIAAGSVGMEGSAVLCTRGAMAAGAGIIRLGTPGDPVGPGRSKRCRRRSRRIVGPVPSWRPRRGAAPW